MIYFGEVISIYTKKCPECNWNSYSACKKGKWSCPYCEENLTDVSATRTKNS